MIPVTAGQLRVMTYNIKNGGDPDRLDSISRVIAAQRPDILALQELRRFDRSGGPMVRLAETLGMRPFLARSRFGQPVAVLVSASAAVASAGAIRRPLHHAAMRVTVHTDRGPLSVISTHLYPYSGWRRLREARWLVSAMKREAMKREAMKREAMKRERGPGGMVLLMGDLNSLDPWTDHAERLQHLPSRYRSRHLRRGILTRHNRGAVDTRAVEVLADAGFVDLFRLPGRTVAAGTSGGGRDYTAPTERGGGAEFSGMRLDYILGTEEVVPFVRTCRIVWGGEAESASDHYPVVAEFDLRLM
jgi:exodeoxyribonuclease-3